MKKKTKKWLFWGGLAAGVAVLLYRRSGKAATTPAPAAKVAAGSPTSPTETSGYFGV